ncbi:MAG: SusD/RagB family nutrient-binding outer membrane lipoprotein [Janthinobacterium lividum]
MDTLQDYNVNTKAASVVPGVTLVTTAERSLTRTLTTTNQNLGITRLLVQYWTETTYNDESRYNLAARQIPENFWTPLFQTVLGNLNEAKRIITADPALDTKVKANQLACIDVLAVHAWSTLVDTYGNIPYSEALNPENPQPKYDDAATIYTDLLKRLDADIAAMNTNTGAAGLGTADLVYAGNMPKWVRYANSLKLRLAMTTVDVDAARTKTLVEQAAPNVFQSSSDNAQITFTTASPNQNPLYEDLVSSGRTDYVGADTFINQLNALNDPRVSIYFQPLGSTGTYVGAPYGPQGSVNTASQPGAVLRVATLPGVLASYSEVQFLLAEAAARNFSVGGTAASFYNNAITASITYWEGLAGRTTAAVDAAAYLAQPSVAYTSAAGDFKQKIGIQKWISLYNQPTQAWTEWRRLDYPQLKKPSNALSEIPLRFTYPTSEQNLNGTNYAAVSTAIGGDKVTTKIFWDKF